LALLSGCGPDAVVPIDALSGSGRYRVEVVTTPSPAQRGVMTAQLSITRSTGEAAPGLTLEVTPWMPQHGHGSSVAPKVTEVGGGTYAVAELYLPMAGLWQLRTAIEGGAADEADVALEVH
jgi:hypothetical protein